ncbi:MAG: hypothetical protein ACTJHU_03750 [Mycetocola sp.]
MLTKGKTTMRNRGEEKREGPGGVLIAGWAGTLLVGLLSFVSLSMATEPKWVFFYTAFGWGTLIVLVAWVASWFIRSKRR